jgi:hypothetical protein
MLTLRPTKMLARRLHLSVPAVPPPVTNRVADWCAHEFTAQRHRYLLFWHTATFLPVLVHGRGVRDDHDLILRLAGGLKLVMGGTELEFHYQRWIAPELGIVQWAPIPSRSVLGTMNDLMIMAKYHLDAGDQSPVELSLQLAETPLSALGMNSPDRAFRSLRS